MCMVSTPPSHAPRAPQSHGMQWNRWAMLSLFAAASALPAQAQAQTCTPLPQRITDSTGSSNILTGWTAADGDGGGTVPTTWTVGTLGFNAAQHWDDQTNLAVNPPATSGIDTLTQTTPPTRVSGGSILQFDIAWNNAQYGLAPNAYDGNRAQLTISYAGVTYVRAQTATAIFRANTLANDTDPGPGTATSALVGDANLAILGGATLLAGSMPNPFRAADAGAPVWATITIRLPDNVPQTGAFVIGVQRIQAGFDQNRTDDFYIRNVTLAPRTLCLRKQTPGPGAGGGNFSFTTTNLDTNYTTSQAAAGGPYDNGPLTMNTTGTTAVVLPDPDTGTTGAQPALVMDNTVTVTETIGTTGFALTGATCDSGVTASIAGNQATLSNINSPTGAGIMVTCTLTNARPRIRLQKALPNGRAQATDQFGLTITGPRGGVGTVATVTTTGTGTTATGTADFNPADTGGSYTLSEAAAGTTVPASYATTYLCTNATAGSTTTMPSGTGASFNLVPAAGDDITCTFTNTRQPATLTLTKISQGGARAFTFTGNNGWTSQTLTTTTSGVGVTGATQTLTNANTATTINETMPSGFVLSNVTCTGMGPGGAVTTGASSFTLNAAAIAGGSNIACTVTNSVQSQPAFPTCPSTMYLSQGPDANTNTTLYNIGTTTNPFTYPALGQGSNVYNGMGFNPVDNYLYAINHGGGTGNRLIRIGSNGSTVDLGPVSGMATADWLSGTFSDTV